VGAGGGGGGTQRGRENGPFLKVMNGRKRKWKDGQGEEKGTDFQIKFSGHLNKHLSQRSNGRGTAGGTCVSWAAREAFQQDTSNKQRLKKHARSPSRGSSSELPPLQFPPCLQLGPKLASISSPVLCLARGTLGWGTPTMAAALDPVRGRAAVGRQGLHPRQRSGGGRAVPSRRTPPHAAAASFFQEQKSKGGEQKLPSH